MEDISVLSHSDPEFLKLVKMSGGDFRQTQQNCDSLAKCWDLARVPLEDKDPANFFMLQKGVLMRQPGPTAIMPEPTPQLVLPKQCRELVLHTAHSNTWAGHLGVNKTKERVLNQFYWPFVYKDIEEFVRSCPTCQLNDKTGQRFVAPMVLVPLEAEPFARQIVDVVGPLRPKTKEGFLYILTMLCPATKFPEAVPLKQADSQSIVDAMLHVFARIGFPSVVQSDLGTPFLSELTTLFLEKCGIRMQHSSVFHPQSNSVERFHRTLKGVLRALVREHPHDWERCLPGAMFAYEMLPTTQPDLVQSSSYTVEVCVHR